MQKSTTVTCSFKMDRELYNRYKSIIVRRGDNVKHDIITYMMMVIAEDNPNDETLAAMEEAEKLANDPNFSGNSSVDDLRVALGC